MLMITLLLALLFGVFYQDVKAKYVPDYYPDQIHLSIGENNTLDVLVTWITQNFIKDPLVEYASSDSLIYSNPAVTEFYNFSNTVEYIHHSTLRNLKPNTTYVYHCGSPTKGWSSEYTFKTFPKADDPLWNPRLILFGDLGVGNAHSLARIQEELFDFPDTLSNAIDGNIVNKQPIDEKRWNMLLTQDHNLPKHKVDAILHIGDFAYDMHDDNGRRGAQFLREIEPIATRVPYITCPGNHESHGNFTQYRHKFRMPQNENMFYSFDLGPAHFISFSTEYYFFFEYGVWQIKNQYEWLENDLIEANKHRDKRPWIITFGHRPMYCSDKNTDDCTKVNSRIRTGVPFMKWYSLEPLFYKYNVDLELWAHEHDYERLWPIYDYKVKNGTMSSNPYEEPRAPVHIITGSAGCSEQHDKFTNTQPSWSAFRSLDYGYTKMWIANKTHIYIEQISDDKNGEIIDKVWIIKEKDTPYETESDILFNNI